MSTILRTLFLTALAVGLMGSWVGSVDASDAPPSGLDQPLAGARAAGMGNASTVAGEHDGWLWTPSLLGFSPGSRVWVSRGSDTPAPVHSGTSDVLAWRKSGFRASGGLRLFAHGLSSPDSASSGQLVRGSGSVGWLASGGAPVSLGLTVGIQEAGLQDSRERGVLGSLSMTYRPLPELFITQGIAGLYGDTFGEAHGDWDASRMLIPTTSISVAGGELPLRGTVEFRGGKSLVRGWRGGLELAPLEIASPQGPFWGALDLQLRTGASEDGVSFGAGLSIGPFTVDYARARYDDDNFDIFSVSHTWGADWDSTSRRDVWVRNHEAAQMLESARQKLKTGGIDAALSAIDRVLELATWSHTREEAEELREQLLQIGPQLEEADEFSRRIETLGRAQEIYLGIQSVVPELPGLDERIKVSQLIHDANSHYRRNQPDRGLRTLREALAIAPNQPAARTLALTEGDGVEASVRADLLYAGLFAAYQEHPPITLVLRNTLPTSIDGGRAVYRLGDLMVERIGASVSIPPIGPDASVEVPLPLALDVQKLAHIEGEAHPSIELTVKLKAADGRSTFQHQKSVTVLEVDMLDWSDPCRFGAYVQDRDTQVRIAAQVLPPTPTPEFAEQLPAVPAATYQMMVVHALLRASDLEYSGEVVSFSERDGRLVPHDRIRPPATVLSEKKGDCEDLAALWASVLKARGVATTLVVERRNIGHVLLLADTELPPTRSGLLCGLEPYALEWNGRLWLPIETTLTDADFLEVVSRGHGLIGADLDRTSFELYPVLECQARYPASHWPTQGGFVAPPRQEVLDGIHASLDDEDMSCMWGTTDAEATLDGNVADSVPSMVHESETTPSTGDANGSSQATGPKSDPDSAPGEHSEPYPLPDLDASVSAGSCSNSLLGGVYLGQTGRLVAAGIRLERAAKCEATRPAALNGLGNVLLLQRDDPRNAVRFYREALHLDSMDDGIRLNLLIAHKLLLMRGEDESAEVISSISDEIRGRMEYRTMLTLLGQVPPRNAGGSMGTEADRSQAASMLQFLREVLASEEEMEIESLPGTARSMSNVGALVYWKKQAR